MLGGKVAVVTGVTSGIGAALVERLLASGATAVGMARSADKLEATRVRLANRAFVPVECDLGDRAARVRVFAALRERFPKIDVLVSNAAECVYDSPLALDPERMLRLFETNVLSGLELVQSLAPSLEGGGHVIALSSVTARFLPNPRFASYAVTKIAVERTMEALRLELEPMGVKVTILVPGLVDTAIYDKVEGFERTRAKIRDQVPVWLSAADVADAAMWVLLQPEHVVVSELVLMPRGQCR